MNAVIWSRGQGRQLGLLAIVSAFLSVIVPGCSVKEDRAGCPSLLAVNTERIADSPMPHELHVWGDGSYHLQERMLPSDYPFRWTARVPKGFNTVSCVRGLEHSAMSGSVISIPHGEQSDRIWTHRAVVDCSGEYAYDTLSMHKQHCVLSISHDSWESFPYGMRIEGGTAGFDLLSGTPVRGMFRAVPLPVDAMSMEVVLPRQHEGDRLVLVLTLDGLDSVDVDIGRALSEAGYSWESLDLADATLWLSRLPYGIEVVVSDWIPGISSELEI